MRYQKKAFIIGIIGALAVSVPPLNSYLFASPIGLFLFPLKIFLLPLAFCIAGDNPSMKQMILFYVLWTGIILLNGGLYCGVALIASLQKKR